MSHFPIELNQRHKHVPLDLSVIESMDKSCTTVLVLLYLFGCVFSVSSNQLKLEDVVDRKTSNVGQKFLMTCTVVDGRGPIQFVWHKNGFLLKPKANVVIDVNDDYSRLIIPKVSTEDAGNYSCRASNSIGLDIKWTDLLVKGLLQ